MPNVGHQLWHQLGMNRILQQAGLSPRACLLTEVMTLNRLICPCSEHAMPDWIRRTALGDLLQEDFSELADEALYRNLDHLHPPANVSSGNWLSGKRRCSIWMTPSICMT